MVGLILGRDPVILMDPNWSIEGEEKKKKNNVKRNSYSPLMHASCPKVAPQDTVIMVHLFISHLHRVYPCFVCRRFKWESSETFPFWCARPPFAGRSDHLDWDARVNIIMGAAKGLAYMHHDCSPRIIHRDIKSSNILLDGNLEARVSDFGLAKLLEDSNSHITTRVAGTFGYLAPGMIIFSHGLTRKGRGKNESKKGEKKLYLCLDGEVDGWTLDRPVRAGPFSCYTVLGGSLGPIVADFFHPAWLA